MFQKASNDRPDPYALRPSRNSGPKAAEPSDDEIYLHARGSPAKGFNQLGIFHLVHFRNDARGKTGALVGDLPID